MAKNIKPLKSRIADLRAKRASMQKEAKIKVASAWTVAKTLLPKASTAMQQKMASAMVELDVKILKSAVRQAAVNAFWSKFAAEMEAEGCPLNKFIDEPSLLEKLKSEMKAELQGEAKNASKKKADFDVDLEDMDAAFTAIRAHYQQVAPKMNPKTREDVKSWIDKAWEMYQSTGGAEGPLGQGPFPEGDDGSDLEELVDLLDSAIYIMNKSKSASKKKKAEYEDPADKQAELDAEEKVHLHEQIEVAEGAVEQLEHEIMDTEGEELDMSSMFDDTDEKVDSLANEDEMGDMDDMDFGLDEDMGDEHGPSETASLEESLDGMDDLDMSEAGDYFQQAAEDDISSMFASEEAEVGPGEAADYFESDAVDHDVVDGEEDHADDLIYDLMKDIRPGTFESKRQTEPELERPKAASKKKAPRPVRSLGHVASMTAEQKMLSSLVFPDDDM